MITYLLAIPIAALVAWALRDGWRRWLRAADAAAQEARRPLPKDWPRGEE
jgi:hypothetical protein